MKRNIGNWTDKNQVEGEGFGGCLSKFALDGGCYLGDSVKDD